MAIRKNVTSLTATEKQQFVQAVLALKDNNKVGNKYNKYVQWHADASVMQTPTGSTRSAAHGGPSFLAWHREYLRRFELDLQAIVPGLALPYWDWAADAASATPKTAPVWAADFMGGNGDTVDGSYVVKTGPFAYGKWVVVNENGNPIQYATNGAYTGALKRQFAAGVATLPAKSTVDAALSITPYDASPWDKTSSLGYRNRLEGWFNSPQLHNRVHRWVGQTMRLSVSPNDPVFFLHHSNIDRLWAQWQALHSTEGYVPVSNGPVGHNLNDAMFPWTTTPAQVIDCRFLGYSYDTLPPV